ncbi:MAG: hypothetical protein WC121_09005 [Candidatus Kapaibacterium sp.]
MDFQKNGWILAGLIFGGFNFLIVTYGTAFLIRQEINWLTYAIGLPLWILCGLWWGYYMKKSLMKQAAKKEKAEAGKTS